MIHRYDRQQRFEPFGIIGQEKLRRARIFILGAGALGSASSDLLVRAGVGHITIVDRDVIEWTNLHRQTLYTEDDVIQQMPKAIAAKQHLEKVNRDVTIHAHVVDITKHNIEALIEGHDAVLDATDNLETRLLANDCCHKLGIPFFMGACVGSYGLTFPIGVQEGEPCLHCLLETLPPESATCDTVGVISPIVTTVAARQTAQLLKWLREGTLTPKLQSTNLWTDEHASIRATALRKQNCPCCGTRSYPYLHAGRETDGAVLCGRETVQLFMPKQRTLELKQLQTLGERLQAPTVVNPFLVSIEWEEYRVVFFKDRRIFVHGTNDIAKARAVVANIIG